MFALSVSSLLCLFTMIALGFSTARFARLPASRTEKALLGLVVANTVLTLLSLLVPIDLRATAGLLMCCLVLAWLVRDDLRGLLASLSARREVLWYALPFLLIAFVVALGPPRAYDTGLYHLQTIKWIEQYAVVPGLANLHGRFGFNPNIFTVFAFTSLSDIFGQQIYSVNFTVFALLVLHFVAKLRALYQRDGVTRLFVFNLVIFLSIVSSATTVSSPSPNFLMTALPLFILVSAVKDPWLDGPVEYRRYLPLLILCLYVVTVKLATIPIMVLFFMILVRFRSDSQRLLWLALPAALIVLPWLARNVILTGWLLYPFPSLDLFNLDWKVPVASVLDEKLAVTGWARNPGLEFAAAARLPVSGWLPAWWHRLGFGHQLLLLAALLAPVIGLAGAFLKKFKVDFIVLAVIASALAGVLFWLTLAPAIAFGVAFLIVAALSPLLYLDRVLEFSWRPGFRLRWGLYAAVLILFCLKAKNITRFHVPGVVYRPQTIETPKDLVFTRFPANGVELSVPVSGDRCYDQPLPCTPYPDQTLTLRNKTLQSGFRHASFR